MAVGMTDRVLAAGQGALAKHAGDSCGHTPCTYLNKREIKSRWEFYGSYLLMLVMNNLTFHRQAAPQQKSNRIYCTVL